jgi:hypothetical protein
VDNFVDKVGENKPDCVRGGRLTAGSGVKNGILTSYKSVEWEIL